MISLNGHLAIGAQGGSRTTETPAHAWRRNAFVKIRPVPPLDERIVAVDPFQRD
jgi:hypothetical protein